MAKGYVPLFFDTIEETADLTDEEFGRLIRAVGRYAMGEEYESIITGNERYAFRFLKGQVDRNTEISNLRAKAGAARKEQTTATASKPEQTETKVIKPEQTKAKPRKPKQNPLFERFWEVYPRHDAKANAAKAFEKHNPDEELLTRMLTAIEKQKQTAQWQEDGGRYVPMAATWLNQERWTDEVKPEAGRIGKAVEAQRYEQRDYTERVDTPDEVMRRLIEYGA